ncbi:MAG TPA: universal stress protein [Thermodesulfovibrionales bacterium]|nr:universal stress protein [Thermodesulfovibrionales bacterium]
MDKYKKILVAFDGSEPGRNALREALKLAADDKSRIGVISVIPPYEGDLTAMWTNDMRASMRKQSENTLEEAAKIAHDQGIVVDTISDEGEIHERIVDLADTENFDLIVIGQKGTSVVERALVGSVAARVIGYSRQDVLVVPACAKLSWQNILVATDGSPYSEAAARRAIEIAKQHQSEFKALSVVDVTIEFMLRAQEVYNHLVAKAKGIADSVKEKALAAGVKAEAVVRDGEVYKVIIDVANETKSDIIIMGSLGKTGIKRLLMGSSAERVLGHSCFPVLIVKP